MWSYHVTIYSEVNVERLLLLREATLQDGVEIGFINGAAESCDRN
jgi:hypothetical protein